MAYKILIVDDEVALTELLSAHLQDCGYKTFTAYDGNQAISKLNIYPDLILLDINMPEMDGLELCKMIRENVTCPILFLTAKITEQDKINGLQAGGDDYITKPFSLQELTARVEAHIRREARSKETPRIVTAQGLILNCAEKKIFYGEKEIRLSNREFEIVEFLASNANQIFDREKIYEVVWGYDAEGDSSVIKEHIRKIRNKLSEITGNEYIETVWGIGYRWRK